jgi:hypothetical protein
MKIRVLALSVITVAAGFGETSVSEPFFTTCSLAAGPPCVLQAAATRDGARKKLGTRDVVFDAPPGPWQQELQLKLYSGANAVVGHIDFPAGMQLSIESVSASATIPTGQTVRLSLTTSVRDSVATYFVPIVKQESKDGADWFLGANALRTYADGPALSILVTRPDLLGDATVRVVVSGILAYAQ